MAQIHWKPGNGDFNDPTRWIGGTVPGLSDDAVALGVAGGYVITDTGVNSVASLALAAGVLLDIKGGHLTETAGIANAGFIFLENNATLVLAGVIDNKGSIIAYGTQFIGVFPTIFIGRDGAILQGGGRVTLSDVPGAALADIEIRPLVTSTPTTLTNIDNVISGVGQIGVTGKGTLNLVNGKKGIIDGNTGGALPMVLGDLNNAGLIRETLLPPGAGLVLITAQTIENSGTLVGTITSPSILEITADKWTNSGLIAGRSGTLDLGAASLSVAAMTNTGVISEIGGGLLILRNLTVANSGGVLEVADANSYFDLNNDTIVGGTLKASGGGTFRASLATVTLDGSGALLTLTGPFLVNGPTLVLKGDIDNQGALSVLSGSVQIAPGGVKLTGGGAVRLSQGATVQAIAPNTLLTNVDNMISGNGVIGLSPTTQLSVVNQAGGVIDAAQFSVDDLNNAGLIGPGINTAGAGNLGIMATTVENGGTISDTVTSSMIGMFGITAVALNNTGTIATAGSVVLDVNAKNLVNTGMIAVGGGVGAPPGLLAGQTIINSGAGTIEATVSGGLSINAGTSFLNNGSIEALGGDISINGAVTGSGTATVGDGATLAFASAATSSVSFVADTMGVLQLGQAGAFTGTLTGFGPEHLLDLRDMQFNTAPQASFTGTAAGGTLTVSSSVATDSFQLVGDYTAVSFDVAADGFGGTRVFEHGSVFGAVGNDTLSAGAGATTLVGMGGTDSYRVADAGTGTTEILNGAAPSAMTSGTPAGELLFGTGVDKTQLWLDRVNGTGAVDPAGSDLRFTVMGTSQSVRVDDWFNPATPSAPLGDIKLTDSGLKLDNAVNTLVAAMASFEASHPAFDPTAAANPTVTDPAVLAAVQSSWHP